MNKILNIKWRIKEQQRGKRTLRIIKGKRTNSHTRHQMKLIREHAIYTGTEKNYIVHHINKR